MLYNRNNDTTANPADMSIEERAALLAAKYSSNYGTSSSRQQNGITREDSTDDLMKSINLANTRRAKRIENMLKVSRSASTWLCT